MLTNFLIYNQKFCSPQIFKLVIFDSYKKTAGHRASCISIGFNKRSVTLIKLHGYVNFLSNKGSKKHISTIKLHYFAASPDQKFITCCNLIYNFFKYPQDTKKSPSP